ncbi:MAG TPA: FeoB-associated Cys-rich membrane protein [Acetivibrio sp.]|nr:FeoB-associated Cys-rich membrane protein [Acetivibrio sp.]
MENLIVAIVILAIVAVSVTKIVIEKKRGARCIGCPHSKTGGTGCCCNHSAQE